MPEPLDPEIVAELERRSARLAAFFDLKALHGQGDTPESIARYYEDSRLGYRFVHSRAGAMHMALNPSGAFDRSGYAGQARLVEERFGEPVTQVLELACGNGFNLALLAPRHPGVRLLGVDLVAAQVRRAKAALEPFPNASAAVGDFQALTLADGSQDLAFVVESFCHATDLDRAFAEIHRVLRPGGRFVVIDAWRTERYALAPEPVRQAAANVELAMAVSGAVSLADWKARAAREGFAVVEDRDLSEQVKPTLDRLARGSEKFLSHPWPARVARAVLPRALVLNAVAGYLMPLTVDLGVHTYRLVMLERR